MHMFLKYLSIVFLCVTLAACSGDFKMPDAPDLSKLFGADKTADNTAQTDTQKSSLLPKIDFSRAPLICSISGGSALVGSGWHPYDVSNFKIRKGAAGLTTLKRRGHGSQSQLQVRFDNDGQKLVFCPADLVGMQSQILCSSIFALPDDYDRGIKRTLDIADALRGGTLECKSES